MTNALTTASGRDGHTSAAGVGSAPALADDYVLVTEQVLRQLNEPEAARSGMATS